MAVLAQTANVLFSCLASCSSVEDSEEEGQLLDSAAGGAQKAAGGAQNQSTGRRACEYPNTGRLFYANQSLGVLDPHPPEWTSFNNEHMSARRRSCT